MRRVLCLSNGHGEDQVGCQIAVALRQRGLAVVALPIVGLGHSYQRAGIPILTETQLMPSGGFNQDWRQLARDLWHGLGPLTWQQWQAIHQQGRNFDLVLAVGDVVVLAMAWGSGRPYAFVGTAKSDYYWGDEHGEYAPLPRWVPWRQQRCDYFPWERWLMRDPRCQGVFPRDGWTAAHLVQQGIPAWNVGNPMVDDLHAPQPLTLSKPALLILPGSRPPEVYRNWAVLLSIIQHLPPQITCYTAVAPGVQPDTLESSPTRPIHVIVGDFAACVHHADVVLAMAGTATEQCVALGKPVVTVAGRGPQFTARFAQKQAHLLGAAVHYVAQEQAPGMIQFILHRLHSDPDWRVALQGLGYQRMGSAGAAERIAAHVVWQEERATPG